MWRVYGEDITCEDSGEENNQTERGHDASASSHTKGITFISTCIYESLGLLLLLSRGSAASSGPTPGGISSPIGLFTGGAAGPITGAGAEVEADSPALDGPPLDDGGGDEGPLTLVPSQPSAGGGGEGPIAGALRCGGRHGPIEVLGFCGPTGGRAGPMDTLLGDALEEGGACGVGPARGD